MLATRFDTATLEPVDLRAQDASGPDLRTHHRRSVAHELWLTDLFAETVLRCRCDNLSAGGIFAIAPVGYGLAVGQRYELRLSSAADAAGSLLVGDSLGYATVIRTQLHADGPEPSVGFAARFDAPQYLPL